MQLLFVYGTALLAALTGTAAAVAIPSDNAPRHANPECRRTKVAILGAGIAGIIAGQTLTNQGVEDFVIVEYQDEIGGRVHHAEFGQDDNGQPLVVEFGANWAQGLGVPDGPENPIWTLVRN
jgi:polyamine oxidase